LPLGRAVYTEKSGSLVHSSAAKQQQNAAPITLEDRRIVSRIVAASAAGSWKQAKAAFDQSETRAIQVYNAAMFAALRNTKYEEGLKIYRQLCAEGTQKTSPTYTAAIKLFSRLGKPEEVQKVWEEADSWQRFADNGCQKLLISSMIDAAAHEGNVYEAARFLDVMVNRTITPDLPAWGSAMNACKNGFRPNAARSFLKSMRRLQVEPDEVMYTMAMIAHIGAPLSKVTDFAEDMAAHGIQPTSRLVEGHVGAVLGKVVADGGVPEKLESIRTVRDDRLATAASVISAAESDGIRLTRMVREVKIALGRLGFRR